MAKRMSTQVVEPPDLVLEKYRLYEEDGKITFERKFSHTFVPTRRRYAYFIAKKELWRVYVKTGKAWKKVYSTPIHHINAHRLEPVWPKHMLLDKGL